MIGIRLFGSISSDIDRLEKALGRIRKAHPNAQLKVAYEAGPCGFVIARRLKQLGVPCLVAAPSHIPKGYHFFPNPILLHLGS
jgi:transposase